MTEGHFASTVSAVLDPILAPRGFPYAAHHNGVTGPGQPAAYNPDNVLFHCDGDLVEGTLRRYPSWDAPLRASYGPHEVSCLDLWVQVEGGVRTWTFEIFEDDVAAAAGEEAMRRLDELAEAPLEEWVGQLARILDAYFTGLAATVEGPGG
jgi:hypothetical protein